LDLNALVNDSKVQLCQNGKKEHTKLTWTLELLRFKVESGLSDRSFT
jgi:hypothetical protein